MFLQNARNGFLLQKLEIPYLRLHMEIRNRILTDMAKAEISKRVEDILRKYMIDAHQSEPYQQQQNPVERSTQDIKRYANYVATRILP